jgi:hypothetical protein
VHPGVILKDLCHQAAERAARANQQIKHQGTRSLSLQRRSGFLSPLLAPANAEGAVSYTIRPANMRSAARGVDANSGEHVDRARNVCFSVDENHVLLAKTTAANSVDTRITKLIQ